MTDLRMSLSGLKTGNGLLFVFSPTESHHAYRIQHELFIGCDAVLQQHGLAIAEIFEQGNSHIGGVKIGDDNCDYLRRLFNVSPGQFKILLLNRQQHIKLMTDDLISDRELLMRMDVSTENFETAID